MSEDSARPGLPVFAAAVAVPLASGALSVWLGQDANWDSHEKLFARHKQLIPPADQGFSALIEDLEARGLLESTLVVGMGEFGRTPKINPAGGRDHWPGCWTIVFAGGGTQGGRVVGISDEIAAAPKDRPVTPAEVVATAYHALGIDLETELEGPQGRPIPVVDYNVKPIYELF